MLRGAGWAGGADKRREQAAGCFQVWPRNCCFLKESKFHILKAVYVLRLAIKVRNAAERGDADHCRQTWNYLSGKDDELQKKVLYKWLTYFGQPWRGEIKITEVHESQQIILEERMFLLCFTWRKRVVVIACVTVKLPFLWMTELKCVVFPFQLNNTFHSKLALLSICETAMLFFLDNWQLSALLSSQFLTPALNSNY